MVEEDRDSFEEVITTFKVTNNGDIPISYISLDFAYYSEDGTCISTDGRFNNNSYSRI